MNTVMFRFFVLFLVASVAALAADTIRPEIQAVFVSPSGNTLTFHFSKPVKIGSGGSGGFTIWPSGGPATLTYASGSGSRALVFATSRIILEGEDVRYIYNQPDDGVEDLAGNDLAHQGVYNRRAGLPTQPPAIVNNNSTQVAPESIAPTLSTATIGTGGTTLTLAFSEAVSFGAGGNGGFVPTLSGGAATASYTSGSGTSALVYTLSRTVLNTETGTLAYTQPGNGVEDAAGNDLATFSGAALVNNSTQTGGITYRINENFEGPGTPSGWYRGGDANFDYTAAPLVGSQSLAMDGATGDYVLTAPYSSAGEVWLKLIFRFDGALPGEFAHIAHIADLDYNWIASITIMSTGKLNVGGIDTTATMAAGTKYYVWLHYKKGTGANAVTEVWFSSTDSKPANGSANHAVATDGNATADTVRVKLAAYESTVVVVDDVRVATESIP